MVHSVFSCEPLLYLIIPLLIQDQEILYFSHRFHKFFYWLIAILSLDLYLQIVYWMFYIFVFLSAMDSPLFLVHLFFMYSIIVIVFFYAIRKTVVSLFLYHLYLFSDNEFFVWYSFFSLFYIIYKRWWNP